MSSEHNGLISLMSLVLSANVWKQEQLKYMGAEVFQKYTHVFEPIPHVDDLPIDVYCRIKFKDAAKTISIWTYSSPQKYWEAWQTLIQSHEDASQIRPSNSEHASPSFLTPKADPEVLPCWVNNYWVLNSNTVLDSYPLLHVDDILADCAKGKIWSHIDMTSSFFQTRITQKCTPHPPVPNECHHAAPNWKNMSYLHWWHCHLVKLNCRTHQTHWHGNESTNWCKAFLQQNKMQILLDRTWFPHSLYLCMRGWTKFI